jgi:FdrA protein
VETSNDKAVRYVGRLLQSLDPDAAPGAEEPLKAVDVQMLDQPLAAINVGLESFTESLGDQGAQALQVDWRPPAGGDVKLMAILERLKSKG